MFEKLIIKFGACYTADNIDFLLQGVWEEEYRVKRESRRKGYDGDKVNTINDYVGAHSKLIGAITSEYNIQRETDDFTWLCDNYADLLMEGIGARDFIVCSPSVKPHGFWCSEEVEAAFKSKIVVELVPPHSINYAVKMYEAAIKQDIIDPGFQVLFDNEQVYTADPVREIFLLH